MGTPSYQPIPSPRVIISEFTHNGMDADSYGLETAVNIKLSDDWRISASHTFLQLDLHNRGDTDELTIEHNAERTDPRNQIQLHSYYRVTRSLEVDASAYYVETLPAFDVP